MASNGNRCDCYPDQANGLLRAPGGHHLTDCPEFRGPPSRPPRIHCRPGWSWWDREAPTGEAPAGNPFAGIAKGDLPPLATGSVEDIALRVMAGSLGAAMAVVGVERMKYELLFFFAEQLPAALGNEDFCAAVDQTNNAISNLVAEQKRKSLRVVE